MDKDIKIYFYENEQNDKNNKNDKEFTVKDTKGLPIGNVIGKYLYVKNNTYTHIDKFLITLDDPDKQLIDAIKDMVTRGFPDTEVSLVRLLGNHKECEVWFFK